MIYLDRTNAAQWRHASGLSRVSARLAQEFGPTAAPLAWKEFRARPRPEDWILTPELFSEAERPGFSAFLDRRPCRVAAIFHDAIPLKHPAITWPASVGRQAAYMKLLARLDRVWAVSAASRQELVDFWQWQGVTRFPPVEILALGANGPAAERRLPAPEPAGPKRVVTVGILEPRKNQTVLIDAFAALRSQGLAFELHLAGRVNPHFGAPILAHLRAVAQAHSGLFYHPDLADAELQALIESSRCTAFPSRAEGCGLPVLESLWLGRPCLCSDIAPVLESAAGGGCVVVAGNDLAGWIRALHRILTDDAWHAGLARQATTRPLPTWAEAAASIRRGLQS